MNYPLAVFALAAFAAFWLTGGITAVASRQPIGPKAEAFLGAFSAGGALCCSYLAYSVLPAGTAMDSVADGAQALAAVFLALAALTLVRAAVLRR